MHRHHLTLIFIAALLFADINRIGGHVANSNGIDAGEERSQAVCEYLEEPKPWPLTIPIYNDAGVEAVLDHLPGKLGSSDTLLIISGNSGHQYPNQGSGWPTSTASRLSRIFPEARLILGVAGLQDRVEEGDGFGGNLQRALADDLSAFDGVAYIYEPGTDFRSRVSEFWTDEGTIQWSESNAVRNVRAASTAIRARDMVAIAKPTGMPLLGSWIWDRAADGEWDYSKLAAEVDELWVQTQSYTRRGGVHRWQPAMDRLASMVDGTGIYGGEASMVRYRGVETPVRVQVTVGTQQTNAVGVEDAKQAMRYAHDAGLDGLLIWWAPGDIAHLKTLVRERAVLASPQRGLRIAPCVLARHGHLTVSAGWPRRFR